MADPETRVEHPNREKSSSKIARAIVLVLLLATIALLVIITIGGWSALTGMRLGQVAYVLVYVALCIFVLRWSRGVLPLATALAMLLLIFAAVSAPGWFDRDKFGFVDPALPESLLGLLTLLLVPLQVLLMIAAMMGFRQAWNVEVEQSPDEQPAHA